MVRARVLPDEHDKESGGKGTECVYKGMNIMTDHRLQAGKVETEGSKKIVWSIVTGPSDSKKFLESGVSGLIKSDVQLL